MNILKNLLKNKQANLFANSEEQITLNSCANCWGKQEYDDLYIERNSHNLGFRKSFVMQFVETYITGVIR